MPQRRMTSLRRLLRITTAMTAAAAITPAYALPTGGQVVGGQADIATSGTQTTITQSTSHGIINWQNFDIGASEQVQFIQPSASSVTLNRVTGGGSASQILGSLSANGTVMLVNPNGVIFGAGAQVNVGSLVATSSDIDNDRFMAGDYRFDKPGNANAFITNNGMITAADAGLVSLVGPNVVNNGVILAKLGKVQLASGDKFTLDLYGDGLVSLEASDAIQKQLVSNSGIISASGGKVLLTAAAAKDQVNSLINMDGIIEATSIGEINGEIEIFAEGANAVRGNVASQKGKKSGSSTVLISGMLNTSGRKAGERGGKITVTGDNVALLAGTVIDASGYQGKSGTTADKAVSAYRDGSAGGDIRIGGDYLGGGTTPTAKNLYVDANALILNDALFTGDAGRSIFWSDGTTQFYGNVYARALGGLAVDSTSWHATTGGGSGDGGFVETSGHGHLDAGGYVDLTASSGKRGTYFLDPTDITIYGNFAPDYATVIQGDSASLASSLRLWLDSSDASTVQLTYGSMGSTATGSSGSNTITVSSATGLTAGARIRLGGAGSVTAASTLGADTYTIASISGTTITLTSNLTSSYSGSAVYQGYVSQLNDKSAAGNNFAQGTASAMPLWVTGAINGNSGTLFDGINDMLTANVIDTNTSNTSTFVVSQPVNASSYGETFKNGNSGGYGIGYGTGTFDSSGNNFIYLRESIAWSPTSTPYGTGVNLVSSMLGSGSVNNYLNSSLVQTVGGGPNTPNSTTYFGGANANGANRYFQGYVTEAVFYNSALSTNARYLIEQYQSGKWGMSLTPPGTGATEVAKATASDGYSVFTTRYLERLSQSANISLQASNNITLDLKSDTLNIASGRDFTLTAGNNIASASSGTIQTAGTGNISLVAGNDILFTNAVTLNATGSGNVSLQANRHVAFLSGGGVTTHGGNITLNSDHDATGGGAIALNNGGNLSSNGGNITLGGGANPLTGYAKGVSGNLGAPDFVSSARGLIISGANLSSAGGDIHINADAVNSSNNGIELYATSISAGSGRVSMQTQGSDIYVYNSGVNISSSASGNAITLISGRNFTNNQTANPFTVSSGRWLVYSTNPASDTLSGLSSSFRRYSCAYGGSCPSIPASGNGLLYSASPTLTATPKAISLAEGSAVPSLSGYEYTISGYLSGDAAIDSVSGSLNGSTNYTTTSLQGNTYAINYASGSLLSSIGYSFSYANNASGITVGQKTIPASTTSRILYAQLPPVINTNNANTGAAPAPTSSGNESGSETPSNVSSASSFGTLSDIYMRGGVIEVDPSLQWLYNLPPYL